MPCPSPPVRPFFFRQDHSTIDANRVTSVAIVVVCYFLCTYGLWASPSAFGMHDAWPGMGRGGCCTQIKSYYSPSGHPRDFSVCCHGMQNHVTITTLCHFSPAQYNIIARAARQDNKIARRHRIGLVFFATLLWYHAKRLHSIGG